MAAEGGRKGGVLFLFPVLVSVHCFLLLSCLSGVSCLVSSSCQCCIIHIVVWFVYRPRKFLFCYQASSVLFNVVVLFVCLSGSSCFLPRSCINCFVLPVWKFFCFQFVSQLSCVVCLEVFVLYTFLHSILKLFLLIFPVISLFFLYL